MGQESAGENYTATLLSLTLEQGRHFKFTKNLESYNMLYTLTAVLFVLFPRLNRDCFSAKH